MSPTPIEESQAELAALAGRLRTHDATAAELDRDLANAIERARTARLSMQEIATHAGVTRTTLYNSLRRAKEHAAKSRPGIKHPNTPQNNQPTPEQPPTSGNGS
jgi:DNA-binding phage protein